MSINKKFIFHNVTTFNNVWVLLISIPFIIFWGYLYCLLTDGNFYLSLVMMFTAFYFGTVLGIIKLTSSNIALWFDNNYMYIQKGNNKFKKYLKSEIDGFYSYDYETKTPSLKSSIITIKFYIKGKEVIYLNDIKFGNKYEEEKGLELKRFLQTAQQELKFEKIKQKKFQNIYWYSKK